MSTTLRRSSSHTCGRSFFPYRSFISTITMESPGYDTLVTCFNCPICWTAISIGSVTSSITSRAVTPGYEVMIWAFLIVNSGSSSRPIFV